MRMHNDLHGLPKLRLDGRAYNMAKTCMPSSQYEEPQ